MSTPKPTSAEVSPRVLEETVLKTITFVRGIGLTPSLRSIMEDAGYTDDVHHQGWSLARTASGLSDDGTSAVSPVSDAIRELAEFNDSGFTRMGAALGHLHPEQARFVFSDVSPSSGVDSVIPASGVLDRLQALEKDDARAASRDADKAALATLAARGYDDKELAHLRSLVDIAMAGAKAGVVPDDMVKHSKALKANYDWYVDWSETAKALVTRRADLIRLGLAKRQKHAAHDDAAPPVAAPAAPATTTPPSPSPAPTSSPITAGPAPALPVATTGPMPA